MRASAGIGEFDLSNRKYLGSKYRLLDFIEHSILGLGTRVGVFFDGFAGTGVVADRFRRHSKTLIVNDSLYSNFVISQAFFCSNEENVRIEQVAGIANRLNNLEPVQGYATINYGGSYFTTENAGLIDAIREEIEVLHVGQEISTQEKYVLLASLLFAVDKVANTVGQYDAFLKNMDSDTLVDGRHLVDSNVLTRLRLRLPKAMGVSGAIVLNNDLNAIVDRYPVDVLYLDPPYSTRQYIDCYHVLENIAKWDKPPVFGKTAKFERAALKSAYSSTSSASEALRELVSKANAGHIVLNYSNEGIMSFDEIEAILSNRGRTEYRDFSYTVFGNGAGQSKKRQTVERLFMCRLQE